MWQANVNGEHFDVLRSTVLPRRTILWSKVRAHVERWLIFGIGSLTALGSGFSAEGGVELGLAIMNATAAVFALTIATAAWLSVRSDTPDRAFRLSLAPGAGAFAFPLIAWGFIDWNNPTAAVAALEWVAGIAAALGIVVWWRAVAEL